VSNAALDLPSGHDALEADVCLILEGTYPYVPGGVSTWVNDLVHAQSHLTFHLITLLPDEEPRDLRYELPKNVTGVTTIYLNQLRRGKRWVKGTRKLLDDLEPHLLNFQQGGGLHDLQQVLQLVQDKSDQLGRRALLNSRPAWDMVERMYTASMRGMSFLDYFWTWRALMTGLFSCALFDLPKAKTYHAVSTGYAGLIAARAKLETGRPVILTEHGIYTNERRIEIAMADWLFEGKARGLALEKPKRDLRDVWIDTFVSYSAACYEASDEIITLYGGNQVMQLRDGASPQRLKIIPNGIDYDRFSKVEPKPGRRPPTVALIGRVVPIKDIKTFIRACAQLREVTPDLRAIVMGPTDEDEEYFEECKTMVRHLTLEKCLEFSGRVKLEDYLGEIDAIVLTSISEAQPLVILEAGAAGVPTVATDVGACREMIEGMESEEPPLGPAGAIVPLSNPTATAHELARLLGDKEWHDQCSTAVKLRVEQSYNKTGLDATYRAIYAEHCNAPTKQLTPKSKPKPPTQGPHSPTRRRHNNRDSQPATPTGNRRRRPGTGRAA
jgi:polysaccharide biosynthesis protein PelF